MISLWLEAQDVREHIYIPKYYDPGIQSDLEALASTHRCISVGQLIMQKTLSVSTGDEIGKAAYGTGDIPFVRTSDIANWEIKAVPKQGVSQEIFEEYAAKQDVQAGDILLVRDGTYLIGTNCFITYADKELLYQSHILKFRVRDQQQLAPEILFLLLNAPIVQRQIRSFQFTADIIDTIGQRINELVLPIPLDAEWQNRLIYETKEALAVRVKGKAFIKQCPSLVEQVLETGNLDAINSFFYIPVEELAEVLTTDTVTAEFGGFEYSWEAASSIIDNIYLPKYYDPTITDELEQLAPFCDLISLGDLKEQGVITYYTGDEIGKAAYGTGDIPFIRTSDFSNWEIKHDPKQGISEEIYEEYASKQNVKENDILLVRDGTYLVGSSCIVTEHDAKSLYCGGLYKITTNNFDIFTPHLLLGLMNSFIVKRQIRTKQFTRDVIDTIGNRLDEVTLPIPKSAEVKRVLDEVISGAIKERIEARMLISKLSRTITLGK